MYYAHEFDGSGVWTGRHRAGMSPLLSVWGLESSEGPFTHTSGSWLWVDAGCWLRDLGSSPCGPLPVFLICGLVWVPSSILPGCLGPDPESERLHAEFFYDPALEVTWHHFHQATLVRANTSPHQDSWKGCGHNLHLSTEECSSHVRSACRMGFGAAIFGKLNLPTWKSKYCFSQYDSLRKRNTEGRQTGEVETTQTCKLHQCPVHSAPRREKHSDPNNTDIHTLMNTHLKPGMITREPSTLLCLCKRKILRLRGLDPVSGATWEVSGSGESPVGNRLSLPQPHTIHRQSHALSCLAASQPLLNPPNVSSSLQSSVARWYCLVAFKELKQIKIQMRK